jgi:multidrug efflux pump subunit AcrA (membrane-fusion protein)
MPFIMKYAVIVRAGLLLLLGLCTACANKAGAAANTTPAPPYVQTVVADDGHIAPSIEIAGVITPYRQVGVTANLSEPLAEVDVVEGERVHAGQVLARQLTDDLEAQLASSERVVSEDEARYAQAAYQTTASTSQNSSAVTSAQASLHQAQVNLLGAQTDLRRYQQLARNGYIPLQTLDQQRVTVASDLQAVAAAQAALASAVTNNTANGNGLDAGAQRQDLVAARAAVDAAQSTVDQLKLEIGRAVIVAPVDGVVDSVNANPGEYPSGRQLFTIEQIAQVYAVLPASTAQVLNVRRGAHASIELNSGYNADPQPHKDHGVVDAVLDQLQPGTTNFTVKVLIDNSDGHLHGGMPCNGFVDLPIVSGVVIPDAAFTDDTHSAVYAVENGVVHVKTVTLVSDDGAHSVVSGLPAGTRIVKDVTSVTVGNGDRIATTPPAAKKK